VAGIGFPGYSVDGTPGPYARLNSPIAVVVDSTGNLYIGDLGNHVIRKVWKATTAIQTIAGKQGEVSPSIPAAVPPATLPTPPDVGDGGLATAATLGDFGPAGLALDASGNLFIADTYNHRIRMVRPQGTISTVVGKGVPPMTNPADPTTFNAADLGDGVSITSACLYYPRAVLITPGNQMLIADFGSNQVRHVYGGKIYRLAGRSNGMAGTLDLNGDGHIELSGPAGLALASNALYIADWGTHRIRVLQR
jgi:sugar lactone lactonase YvrE